jgi:U4/U6 small nuclear ribonucleoprotein PRP31
MSLADSFLEDLDDLDASDDDGGDARAESTLKASSTSTAPSFSSPLPSLSSSSLSSGVGASGGSVSGGVLAMTASSKGLSTVATLHRSEEFKAKMARIEDSLSHPAAAMVGKVEDNPEYRLIVSCNDLVMQIDEEVLAIYRFVVDQYAKKFPELESLVPGRQEYLKVVKEIGNQMDMTNGVDLATVLPNALVISVSMTASTTSGQPLSELELEQCMRACDEAAALDDARAKILQFVETRMTAVAPNICALLDTAIAAQLMGLCGGLLEMSKMPACNFQVIGQQKLQNLGGFGSAAAMPHTGLIYYSTVIQQAPLYLRRKALKVTAGKLALAARMDIHQSEHSGAAGQSMRTEIDEKIAKWQEPDKARLKKALPAPDDRPSKKRGGKRARKYKEKFGMTEIRKEANRRAFGDMSGGEYGDDAMGQDMGMLGTIAGGKLRAPQKKYKPKQKQQPSKKLKVLTASSGATNGLSSSLVFTPMQGMELVGDANAQREAKVAQVNKDWFSQASGFISARPAGR